MPSASVSSATSGTTQESASTSSLKSIIERVLEQGSVELVKISLEEVELDQDKNSTRKLGATPSKCTHKYAVISVAVSEEAGLGAVIRVSS